MHTYTLTPQKIAEVTGGSYVGTVEAQNTPVTGAVRDNRDARPGNLFVCIQGERTDGHLYANDAFAAGASCCLTEREIPGAKGAYIIVPSTLEAIKTLAAHHRKNHNIPVIGITGSVGKTTTKELIAAALGVKLKVLKTEKNLNNELGVPLTLLALREKHEAAVVEMGISGFGEMHRLAQMVKPDIFILTSIGYSHTNELGDLDGVLRAKTEALAHLKPGGTVILNGDDKMLRDLDTKAQKITFGLGEHCDYRAQNIKTQGIAQIEMDIFYKAGADVGTDAGTDTPPAQFHAEIPAYGSHLATLAPCALAAAHLLGLTNEEIAKGLSSYTNIEGRSNVSVKNGITLINDCYNANPSSVKAALESLRALKGRRVAILGDMLNLGDASKQLHYEIGTIAAQCGVEMLLCCGEEAQSIADGYNENAANTATAGDRSNTQASHHYESPDDLIRDLPSKIKKGDAVLIKASRGMHFEKLLPTFER